MKEVLYLQLLWGYIQYNNTYLGKGKERQQVFFRKVKDDYILFLIA